MNEMYRRALEIARTKVRGGPEEPYFRKPFVDAAFSENIFLWDSCFIASWGKYHLDELPVTQSLDNFYELQEEDGFICREYAPDGSPCWVKEHPISNNPPLLGWAELQLYSQKQDQARLARVYPRLKKHYTFIQEHFRGDDGLYFCDCLGSGMDNISRHPPGWTDDGKGIPISYVNGDRFRAWIERGYKTRAAWNSQGRMVDISSQMALFAENLAEIAGIIGATEDIPAYRKDHAAIAEVLNEKCWNEREGFYFDLGYDKQIERRHIGMFWSLLAGLVPPERVDRMIAQLTDPRRFGRPVPVPSLSADEPEYAGHGAYWHGGVWLPTNYMVFLGLKRVGREDLARDLAAKYYRAVEEVFRLTGTLWENYAPEGAWYGWPVKPDFCGWTAAVPISVYREFVT